MRQTAEQIAERRRRYRQTHHAEILSYNQRYRARNGDLNRNRDKRADRLKYNYGLTVDQYAAMLAAQGGGCKICGTNVPGGNAGSFRVDHDHKTGKVRGLLCHRCNVSLGGFGDSKE